jgi:2-keto-4-pentenoate hydratase/2-oxohepta-3-ene-1,7-dioic acid hydratase in catechol pathway
MLKKYLIILCLMVIPEVMAQQQVFCRYETNGKIFYGLVENGNIYQLTSEPWNNFQRNKDSIPIKSVKLLNPTNPELIAGLIKSYKQGWKDKTPPSTVRWFIKPPASAGVPEADIILPASLDEIKVEVEMIIVIGKKVKNANEKEAEDAIFGYTEGSDIMGNPTSFHKLNNEKLDENETGLSLGLKAGDGFEPYGPFIYKNVNWENRKTFLKVTDPTGKLKVDYKDNTSNLLYTPGKIVSDLSKVMTLSPGDIISSGTGKSFIVKAGDVIHLGIDGFGEFSARVIKQ